MERIYIQKIESGIRGIKLGTKKPEDIDVLTLLEKLKPLNEARYEELMTRFLNTMKEYKKKK
jgi:hypothetical protein